MLPYFSFGLLFLGCVAGLGFSYSGLRGLILENEARRLSQRLAASADRMDDWLTERKVELATLALTQDVRQGAITSNNNFPKNRPTAWQEVFGVLQRLQGKTLGSPYALFLLANRQGIYATSRSGLIAQQTVQDREYFQRAIAGETYISSPFRSRSTGKILISISTPVIPTGRRTPEAVLAGSLSQEELVKLFDSLNTETTYGFVLNRQGRVIFHPQAAERSYEEQPTPPLTEHPNSSLRAIAQAMLTDPTGSGIRPLRHPNRPPQYVVYQRLTASDWSVALVVESREIDAVVYPLNGIALMMLFLLGLAAYLRWLQILTLVKLQQSQGQLQAMVANVPGVVYRRRLDADKTPDFMSDFAQELTGYPASDFIAHRCRTYASVIHPDDRDSVAHTINQALGRKSSFEVEYRLITAQGAVKWVHERGCPALYQGNPVLYGTITDVTERRLATQSLQAALEESLALNAILNHLADGLLVVDMTNCVLHCNPAFEQQFALSTAGFSLGTPLADLPLDPLHPLIDQARLSPQQSISQEVSLRQGRIGRAIANTIFCLDAQRQLQPMGVVVLVRDITTEYEIDQMKTDFIAMVSHELRTPLTSILGFTVMIEEKLESEVFARLTAGSDSKLKRACDRIRGNLHVIVDEAERLTSLINDLLDIAKMEAGKTEWQQEVLDLASIVERATIATMSLFERSGLTLHSHIPDTLPPCMGDRDRLIQVVINLISNAVKFTPTGSITCGIIPEPEQVILYVRDTGVGIAPEDCAKVFDKFQQVGSPTAKTRGTGLGLSICQQIVEHHGGRIWVESTLGQGSTFYVSLPLGTGDASNATFATFPPCLTP
jgi:PAS domain S-box-containing protein